MRLSKAVMVMILVVVPLTAQEKRSVTGTVRDENGRPVVGAVVQMLNMESQQIWTSQTKQGGEFRFDGVSTTADYQLTAKVGAYTGNVRHVSQFDHRPTAVVNLWVDTDWWRNRR